LIAQTLFISFLLEWLLELGGLPELLPARFFC
jgi:hypothetical protein